ncbi:MAG: glycosyltransferase family 2 protein [Candidatus Woesearchaeota archaeon]|nr:glycosyltransferase family 2 protein [Candidatus Woesearchaeota archaeon]
MRRILITSLFSYRGDWSFFTITEDKINIIITMAGQGKRFLGFREALPKHMIKVKGKTMFEWALSTLRDFFNCNFIFVALDLPKNAEFINEKCETLGIKKRKVILLKEPTSGQAETALKAEQAELNPDEPIIIYNIDTYVEQGEIKKEDIKGDGWIPSFPAKGAHWSFVEFDRNMRLKKIAEKERISEFGTIGLYYFKSFSLFKHSVNEYYKKNSHIERYVAPVYNELLKGNKEVYVKLIPSEKVHVIGTPDELAAFEKDEK